MEQIDRTVYEFGNQTQETLNVTINSKLNAAVVAVSLIILSAIIWLAFQRPVEPVYSDLPRPSPKIMETFCAPMSTPSPMPMPKATEWGRP